MNERFAAIDRLTVDHHGKKPIHDSPSSRNTSGI
jgi:hypothetical protein